MSLFPSIPTRQFISLIIRISLVMCGGQFTLDNGGTLHTVLIIRQSLYRDRMAVSVRGTSDCMTSTWPLPISDRLQNIVRYDIVLRFVLHIYSDSGWTSARKIVSTVDVTSADTMMKWWTTFPPYAKFGHAMLSQFTKWININLKREVHCLQMSELTFLYNFCLCNIHWKRFTYLFHCVNNRFEMLKMAQC